MCSEDKRLSEAVERRRWDSPKQMTINIPPVYFTVNPHCGSGGWATTLPLTNTQRCASSVYRALREFPPDTHVLTRELNVFMGCNWRIINSYTLWHCWLCHLWSPSVFISKASICSLLVKNHILMWVLQPQSGEMHTHYNWVLLRSDKLCMNLMVGVCGPCWCGICKGLKTLRGICRKIITYT